MTDFPLPLAHLTEPDPSAVPIHAVTAEGLAAWTAGQPAPLGAWLAATGFTARPGSQALVPDAEGKLAGVLLGVERPDDPWAWGGLPGTLPEGAYRLAADGEAAVAEAAALGWALGCYAFTRYKAPKRAFARLAWPAGAGRARVGRLVEAICRVRDLVNTPAEDLGPEQLAEAGAELGRRYGATSRILVGEALLAENYPTIHAVGRAAARAPRLLDLTWRGPGAEDGPQVVLVGKGVCFDSGGLDLKPSSGMLLMKKDMGGGAHAIALAGLVMDAGLPVRLRLLVPCVENAVSGNAFRPLDVLRTRKGLTVEVGNTDAEGRLILCDALAEADAMAPDLILDFATLTGAARVALGPELPALFSNDDATAEALLAHGRRLGDPLWRLPLHQPYLKMLDSRVADLNNVSSGGFAGSVTAALFLEQFVSAGRAWAHLDLFAWNPEDRPGRPKGGEAMGLRSAFALIEDLAAR
ncbi:leucyl aminopeptidase [Tistlia consotensis]|uniref:Leucyl aminopeptidase n=1 Tax=Tistlia consotensis USBA 355 TaxID=560819 RepID=A0A1Y6BJU7_9PROT|nr:leucyl aminopeptidase family protein [Tistlia consotensis]SMF07233.1 leucyl aminopeptidase [Tistlia consotensis USBA 355]SNR35999.1 leucyl aminopeptidase [Tistlia consotensis]